MFVVADHSLPLEAVLRLILLYFPGTPLSLTIIFDHQVTPVIQGLYSLLVKSLRSSYTGLYPQTLSLTHTLSQSLSLSLSLSLAFSLSRSLACSLSALLCLSLSHSLSHLLSLLLSGGVEASSSSLLLPTYKTVKARFWPWLSGKCPSHPLNCWLFALPGYSAHKKQRSRRTLQLEYAYGPMVVLRGWVFSCGRDTPVQARSQRRKHPSTAAARRAGRSCLGS